MYAKLIVEYVTEINKSRRSSKLNTIDVLKQPEIL